MSSKRAIDSLVALALVFSRGKRLRLHIIRYCQVALGEGVESLPCSSLSLLLA